jgi:hypothetical protein
MGMMSGEPAADDDDELDEPAPAKPPTAETRSY